MEDLCRIAAYDCVEGTARSYLVRIVVAVELDSGRTSVLLACFDRYTCSWVAGDKSVRIEARNSAEVRNSDPGDLLAMLAYTVFLVQEDRHYREKNAAIDMVVCVHQQE